MRMDRGAWVVVGLGTLWSSACGTPSSTVCAPGAAIACTCSDGNNGAQTCLSDGSGYGTCTCGAIMTDAGTMVIDSGIVLRDTGPTGCNAANCGGGCCSGTFCQSGDVDTACGTGGGVCLDCGSHGVCSMGMCYVAPASMWTVVVDSVTLTTTDYTGAPWDPTSGPDPLVWVRVGSATATPTPVNGPDDTLSITYTAGNRIPAARADAIYTFLRFEIYDEDLTANDGVCNYTYDMGAGFDFSSTENTAVCTQDAARMISAMTLTWHIEPS